MNSGADPGKKEVFLLGFCDISISGEFVLYIFELVSFGIRDGILYSYTII